MLVQNITNAQIKFPLCINSVCPTQCHLCLCYLFLRTTFIDFIVNLVTTEPYVPKNAAIETNLLLYRILNEQIDM